MRIGTAHAYDNSIDVLQKRQVELARSQEQLTSGKRVLRASDDPTAAARAERALAAIDRAETSQRALEASQNAMTLTESALGNANDLLQQAREALVAAGNGSYSDAERAVQAQKLQSLRDQLLAVANRDDGTGHYLFAGQGSSTAPFSDMPGGVQYQAVAGTVQVKPGEPMPLTVDGNTAWMKSRTGNGVFETQALAGTTGSWIDTGTVTNPAAITTSTYTVQFTTGGASGTTYSVLKDGLPTALTNVQFQSGQAIAIDGMSFKVTGTPTATDSFQISPSTASLSVFDVLDSAISELKTTGRTNAQVTQTVQTGLRDIDSGLSGLQTLRSEVGQMLNRAESVESHLGDDKLAAQTEQSAATDLDMVQGISDFQNKQNSYDAALKSYSAVQRMSLFDYIKT